MIGSALRWCLRRPAPTYLRAPGVSADPTAIRNAANPTAPNLLWVADLALVRTEEGWLHLAFVLDCYSRRCLGWWWAAELRPEPLVRAVQMAVAQRWPSIPIAQQRGRLIRDTALALSRRCRAAGIAAGPEAEPSTMDAAVAESFLSMLRRDLLDAHGWETRAEASDAVSTWIECYYNPQSAPGSPLATISSELDELSL